MPASKPKTRKRSLRKRTVDEARKLRKTMSFPEALLWRELKGDKLGVPFRKQHPIGLFKADFCCTERKLVVEVDGFVHDTLDQALRDERRDASMRAAGFDILRVPATDVLKDLDGVLQRICLALPPLHHPSDGPPPRERGGFE